MSTAVKLSIAGGAVAVALVIYWICAAIENSDRCWRACSPDRCSDASEPFLCISSDYSRTRVVPSGKGGE